MDGITVETDLFEHREVKPYFINPCYSGEDFAAWLKQELSRSLCDDKKKCIPRSALPWWLRAQLALMSFASQESGVSYFVGVQGSGTATGGGFMGVTAGGSAVVATDPQGNQALVISTSAAGQWGLRALAEGFKLGLPPIRMSADLAGQVSGVRQAAVLG